METVTLQLKKSDIWNMIRGVEPESMQQINNLHNLGLGCYTGGFSDSWQYASKVPEHLGIEELLDLYKELTGYEHSL